MRRQLTGAESIRCHYPAARVEAACLDDEGDQRRHQPLVGSLHLVRKLLRKLRHRHQLGPDLLRQGFHQLQHLLLEQPGHQPFTAQHRHLIEVRQWHGQRHAVAWRTGLKVIGERVLHTAKLDLRGEGIGRHSRRLVPHQVFALEEQELRVFATLFALGFLAPQVKIRAVVDTLGNHMVVEGVDQLVINQHIRPARFVFERLDFADQLLVVLPEGPAPGEVLVHFATDQALADENFACLGRVHRAKIHPLFRIDDNAVERRALPRNDLHRLLLPVRIEVAAANQVSAHFLEPQWIDAGNAAGVELGCLGDLTCHQPAANFLLQGRRGMDQELDSTRAEEIHRVLGAATDVAEQAGEQRLVDGLEARRNLVFLPPLLADHRVQLAVGIPPFTHTIGREESRMAGLHQFPLRFLVLDLALVPLPQLEPGQELRLLVGPLGVRGIGRALLLLRSFARVLHGQSGGNDQHLVQAAAIAGSDDHARDARVERQLGQALTDGRQYIVVVERIQLLQQLVAIGDRPRRRRFEEGEFLNVAELQAFHAQDDASQ